MIQNVNQLPTLLLLQGLLWPLPSQTVIQDRQIDAAHRNQWRHKSPDVTLAHPTLNVNLPLTSHLQLYALRFLRLGQGAIRAPTIPIANLRHTRLQQQELLSPHQSHVAIRAQMILLANPLLIFRQQRPAGVIRAPTILSVSLLHMLLPRQELP